VLEIFSAETTATTSILTTSLTDIQSIGGWLEKKFSVMPTSFPLVEESKVV